MAGMENVYSATYSSVSITPIDYMHPLRLGSLPAFSSRTAIDILNTGARL